MSVSFKVVITEEWYYDSLAWGYAEAINKGRGNRAAELLKRLKDQDAVFAQQGEQ